MTREALEYCLRGIVQHLNGDVDKFNEYVSKAMKIHENEKLNTECNYSINDLIPAEIKDKLYHLVS